jgi:small subunit ribosomal protein S7
MPRRASRKTAKRQIASDAKYGSVIVATLINKVMRRGQKATSERIVYGALEIVEQEAKEDPAGVLEQALKNVTPLLMIKPRRIGGATYQVPMEVPVARGRSLAMRWLLNSARAREGRDMKEKLAREVLDAVRGQGASVKKRSEIHKMAEANKAFAHYRW